MCSIRRSTISSRLKNFSGCLMNSRKLIEKALPVLRKRFMAATTSHFDVDSVEHDLVIYRSKKLFDYNVGSGKNSRSLLSLESFRALSPDKGEEDLEIVAQISAILEMVQAFYLIADDIMDGSETRRGKKCWYKMPSVGLSAVNDAFLLDGYAEDLYHQILPAHPNLNSICSAYRRSKRITMIGQFLDGSAANDVESFSWERYEQLVQHKTSHYTIFHPVEQALLLSDVLSGHPSVRKLCYQIGFLFQSQDDILDVFGDPAVTGKIGTDLQDGKCTWVTVRAVDKLRKEGNLDEFKKVFGSPQGENLLKLQNILADLKINQEFQIFEKHFASKIREEISRLPTEVNVLTPVLDSVVEELTRRQK